MCLRYLYHTIKKNTDSLVADSKESEREVNADNTKNMVMSRGQNAGRGHNVKDDNRFFVRVEEFRCLETTLTNQNSIQE